MAQTTRKPWGPNDSGLNLRSKLEKDLSLSLMWRAVLKFGEPAITRKELLAQFRAIETNYPGSEYHARAKATAERLAIMIAEDERHEKSPPKPLSELPMEERIRELIFQLRDQNGQQWCQPGECDIFLNPHNATNTAAHQLVNIGYPAVPQLIAALDDPTFTRSVGYHRNFYFSHTVLTVGDCAAFILNRIAGKAFYTSQSTSSYLSKDGNVAQVRKEPRRGGPISRAKARSSCSLRRPRRETLRIRRSSCGNGIRRRRWMRSSRGREPAAIGGTGCG